MKTKYFSLLLLLVVGLLSFSGCGDDDDNNTEELLNYDDANFTAPVNGQGLNSFAAYFPDDVLQDFSGRRLSGIQFWLQTIPTQTNVVIYGYSGNDAIPGDELYRIDLTQRVNNPGWVTHQIPGGLAIPADGLWLAVETDLAADFTQSMGCDEGLNYNPNGDRMRTPTSGGWSSFNGITGSETINWNIRGVLAAE